VSWLRGDWQRGGEVRAAVRPPGAGFGAEQVVGTGERLRGIGAAFAGGRPAVRWIDGAYDAPATLHVVAR
jgi:hypothetical protein